MFDVCFLLKTSYFLVKKIEVTQKSSVFFEKMAYLLSITQKKQIKLVKI